MGPDYYSRLVTAPAKVYGEVKKVGVLPKERYDDKLFNHTAFREWLLREVRQGSKCRALPSVCPHERTTKVTNAAIFSIQPAAAPTKRPLPLPQTHTRHIQHA
mgnify:CR=1 FL=1